MSETELHEKIGRLLQACETHTAQLAALFRKVDEIEGRVQGAGVKGGAIAGGGIGAALLGIVEFLKYMIGV